MLTDRLINELGLLKLQAKGLNNTHISQQTIEPVAIQTVPTKEPQQTVQAEAIKATNEVKLDKNEFRLLVKMLHAIGHECTYDHIIYNGQTVTYQHPKKTLVFNDIKQADTDQIMHLSGLAELLANEELKRPVWEKLKTLQST